MGGGSPQESARREQGNLKFSCVPSIQSDGDSGGGSNAAQQSRTGEKALRPHGREPVQWQVG